MLRAEDMAFMQQMLAQGAPAAEEPVTYRKYAGTTTGDRAGGTPETPVYDPPAGTQITAVVNPVSLTVQASLGGRTVAGDVVLMIRTTVLTAKPGAQDRIDWAGGQYEPLRITAGTLLGALFWIVRCRRL